jgi:hypothetical protein
MAGMWRPSIACTRLGDTPGGARPTNQALPVVVHHVVTPRIPLEGPARATTPRTPSGHGTQSRLPPDRARPRCWRRASWHARMRAPPQQQATAGNGRQRRATAGNGRQRQATAGNGGQRHRRLDRQRTEHFAGQHRLRCDAVPRPIRLPGALPPSRPNHAHRARRLGERRGGDPAQRWDLVRVTRGRGARSRSRRSVRALMAAPCGWRPTPSCP